MQLSAEGTAADPRIAGTLRVGGGRVQVTDGHEVTDVELGAHYDNGVLVVDRATAMFEGASLSATARVPGSVFAELLPASIRGYLAAASGSATLSAQLRSVTQSIAAPWVDPATLEQIGLRADASIDLETDRPALDALRGTVVLSRAELSLAGASLDQEVPTRLAIRDGRVTIDAFRLGKGDNQVALEGGVTISGDPALDLSAKGALDLRMLNAVVPAARTVGRGDFGIRVGGTGRAPTVDGYLTLSSGETRMADPRLIVADVNGTISFRGDTITFEHLSATMNGGDAELAGSLRLQGPAALDGSVTLTVKDAALDIAGLRAESDAALTWTVNATRPRARRHGDAAPQRLPAAALADRQPALRAAQFVAGGSDAGQLAAGPHTAGRARGDRRGSRDRQQHGAAHAERRSACGRHLVQTVAHRPYHAW